MKTCISCGMPLDAEHGLGTETAVGGVCDYCIGEDGLPKDCDTIFEGGVQFFMTVEGVDKDMAERVTRKNMNGLPYWKEHRSACLDGAQATDEEFGAVLSKL